MPKSVSNSVMLQEVSARTIVLAARLVLHEPTRCRHNRLSVFSGDCDGLLKKMDHPRRISTQSRASLNSTTPYFDEKQKQNYSSQTATGSYRILKGTERVPQEAA